MISDASLTLRMKDDIVKDDNIFAASH